MARVTDDEDVRSAMWDLRHEVRRTLAMTALLLALTLVLVVTVFLRGFPG